MANGLVPPPSNDIGLTSGNDSGGTPPNKGKRNIIIAGAAAGGLLLVYLFAKSKSSSTATSGTAAPEVVAPANNQDTDIAGLQNTLSEGQTAILANQQSQGSSLTNALSSLLTQLEQSIAGSQSAIQNQISAQGSTAAGPAPSQLPAVNAAQFPTSVAYGSYTSSEFTEIGEDVAAGIYNGKQVGGGVPVYASNGFGGLVQGISPSNAKAGTTFYIPSQFVNYLSQ